MTIHSIFFGTDDFENCEVDSVHYSRPKFPKVIVDNSKHIKELLPRRFLLHHRSYKDHKSRLILSGMASFSRKFVHTECRFFQIVFMLVYEAISMFMVLNELLAAFPGIHSISGLN